MDFSTQHPLQPFWHLAAAPVQTQALELALRHRLFMRLEHGLCAQDVARQLGFDAAAVTVWLDMLWSMALLARSLPAAESGQAEYRMSALARRYFLEGGEEDCGQAWRYRASLLGRVAQGMETLLREGPPGQGAAGEVAGAGSWAQAANAQIDQEQRAVTVPAVMTWLSGLWPDLPEQGRFLDLGGGPGHVGIALARRLPAWVGHVADLADTVEVARRNIALAGFDNRMEGLACNLDRDGLPEGQYDLIWCSSVLHFMHDPQAVLGKMRLALRPMGRLLIAHAEIADDPQLAARVLPFYAPMMWRGKHVWHAGEMRQALTLAGFSGVRSLGRADFPMAPVWAYLGVRP